MASWRNPIPLTARIPLVAASLVSAVLLTGCAGSGAGGHPVIDPDVGTGSPTSTSPAPTDRCPATFGQLQPANGPVSPPVSGPGTLAVPTGARQALVCFYGPITTHNPPTLRWSRVLDHVQAAALLSVVDEKVQRQTDLIGPINCPMDNGTAAILRFSYADTPSQDVLLRMTGCQPASSEHGTTLFRSDITRAVLNLQAPVVQN